MGVDFDFLGSNWIFEGCKLEFIQVLLRSHLEFLICVYLRIILQFQLQLDQFFSFQVFVLELLLGSVSLENISRFRT